MDLLWKNFGMIQFGELKLLNLGEKNMKKELGAKWMPKPTKIERRSSDGVIIIASYGTFLHRN